MAENPDVQRRGCLVWVTERPAWHYDIRSSNFWLLGSEWNFNLCPVNDGYKINLNKVSGDQRLRQKLTVTTFIRVENRDSCLCQVSSNWSSVQTICCFLTESANKALGSPGGKLTITFIFHCSSPLMLYVPGSEKDLSEDKCVQASLDIPPHLESLSSDFCQLLESEIFTDVKVRCGDRTISAHRSILAARSEVFTAMFTNKMAESETGTVDITDVDSDVLDLLLQYLYSGKIPDLSYDTASSLYEAGDKYSIHALKKSCSDWMVRNLTAENCLGSLLVADAHSDEDFKGRVVDFVAENLKSIKKDAWCKFNKEHGGLVLRVYERRLAPTLAEQA